MAFEQNGQTYYDTQPTGENNTTVDYTDPTDVPEIDDEIKNGVISKLAQDIASWIRNEMGRKHVREALARSVEYFSVLFNKLEVIIYSNTAKQNNVEQRQSKIERDFITRISNATVNSEIINARKSDVYGQFNTLDLRVENIENIMSNFVPSGFIVKINHNLNRNPTVVVKKYDWAIGTEPTGFDTAPDGLFGGGAIEIVPTNLIYADGIVYVHMPLVYKQSGNFILKSDTELLLIDGTHTLSFEFEGGLIDGTITEGQITDMPITHTAYAYSADGTDGFTTTYPNLNLSNNTKLNYDILPTGISNGGGTDKSEKIAITDLPGFSWGRKYTPSTRAALSGMRVVTDVSKLKIGDTITNSYWVKNTGSRPIKFVAQIAFRYGNKTEPNDGVSTGWNYTNRSDIEVKNDSKWTKLTFTAIIPQPTVASNRTGDILKTVVHYAYSSVTMMPLAVNDTFIISPLKLELGSTATPYMPSASELPTTDAPTYFGLYTDFIKIGSTNPSDYNWSSIPR